MYELRKHFDLHTEAENAFDSLWHRQTKPLSAKCKIPKASRVAQRLTTMARWNANARFDHSIKLYIDIRRCRALTNNHTSQHIFVTITMYILLYEWHKFPVCPLRHAFGRRSFSYYFQISFTMRKIVFTANGFPMQVAGAPKMQKTKSKIKQSLELNWIVLKAWDVQWKERPTADTAIMLRPWLPIVVTTSYAMLAPRRRWWPVVDTWGH